MTLPDITASDSSDLRDHDQYECHKLKWFVYEYSSRDYRYDGIPYTKYRHAIIIHLVLYFRVRVEGLLVCIRMAEVYDGIPCTEYHHTLWYVHSRCLVDTGR